MAEIKIDCSKNPLIICIRYTDNPVISQDMVSYTIHRVLEISSGKPFGIMANFQKVIYIEEEARKMFSFSPDNLIAVAVVFDSKKQNALKSIFISDAEDVKYSFEFFDSEGDAKNWLLEKLPS